MLLFINYIFYYEKNFFTFNSLIVLKICILNNFEFLNLKLFIVFQIFT